MQILVKCPGCYIERYVKDREVNFGVKCKHCDDFMEPSQEQVSMSPKQLEKMRSIAVTQKAVLVCFVVNMVASILCQLVLLMMRPESLFVPSIIVASILVPLGLILAVLGLALSLNVFGSPTSGFLGFLMFVPGANLVALVIVFIRSVSVLRENGVHVGFFGANMAQFG